MPRCFATDDRTWSRSSTSPSIALDSAGLALAIGLLAGSLNGAAFGRDIPRRGPGFGVNSGQFVIALDVRRFAPAEEFAAELDRHVETFALSKPLPGVDRVRVPGQARAQRKRERGETGVTISAPLAQQLDALAQRCRIAPLQSRQAPRNTTTRTAI